MIVTLGRQCGCAGDEVGKKLSELLGIPFYTKPELIALAKEKKIYEKYPMYFGEQPVNAMISSVADDFCPRNQYDTPKRALSAMFGGQSFIIIGRASNYAYRDDKDAVRHVVRLESFEISFRVIVGINQILVVQLIRVRVFFAGCESQDHQ